MRLFEATTKRKSNKTVKMKALRNGRVENTASGNQFFVSVKTIIPVWLKRWRKTVGAGSGGRKNVTGDRTQDASDHYKNGRTGHHSTTGTRLLLKSHIREDSHTFLSDLLLRKWSSSIVIEPF